MSKCYFLCMTVKDSSYQKDDKFIEAYTLSGLEYDPWEDMIIDVKSFNVKKESLQTLPVPLDNLPGYWVGFEVRPTVSNQGGIFNIVENVTVYNESKFSFEGISKGKKDK